MGVGDEFPYNPGKVLEFGFVFLVFTKNLPYTGNGHKKWKKKQRGFERKAKKQKAHLSGSRSGGLTNRTLEAIKQVTETEQSIQTRRAAAEAEARQITADAEKAGQALVKQARTEAAEQGKALLRQAEERAAVRAKEIAAEAEAESKRQRQQAEARLEAAAEFIVERVVKH